MRQFGRGERDDGMGWKRAVGCEGSGIGVPSGRQIDGDHRRIQRAHAVAQRSHHSAQRWLEAGADHGIQKQVRRSEQVLDFRGIERGFIGRQHRGQRHLLEGGFRVALQIGGITQQQNADFASGAVQFPRGDKAIAAVVALAAQNRDVVRRRKFALDKTRNRRSGLMHQVKRCDTVPLRRGAIDAAHFVGGQNFHCRSSATPCTCRR